MLETVWFAIWGVAWAVYFVLDGFDLGIGILYPFLGRREPDRQAMVAAMGPFWNGNEVWLITAGGVMFAAFPAAYAVMFSAFYTPLTLLLFGLILRGVALEFRGKEDSQRWRSIWDVCLAAGSAVPALLFGVAFSNIFAGIPINGDGVFEGNLFTLLTPYGLLGGVLFVLLFAEHGALWLAAVAPEDLRGRARGAARFLWVPTAIAAVAFLLATWFATPLWQNVLSRPYLLAFPALAVAGLVAVRIMIAQGVAWKAWFASSAVILGAVLFGVSGLYPSLLPSSIESAATLTAFNSASSPLTLGIMLGVVSLFLPVVIGYQIWAYLALWRLPAEPDAAPY